MKQTSSSAFGQLDYWSQVGPFLGRLQLQLAGLHPFQPRRTSVCSSEQPKYMSGSGGKRHGLGRTRNHMLIIGGMLFT